MPHDQRAGRPAGSPSVSAFSRRAFIASAPLLLAGCVTADYGSQRDGGFVVPAVDTTSIDSSLMRQEVAWHCKEKPGTVVVKLSQRRLYLVEPNGRAIRYGVGVGRSEGVNFRGSAVVGRKEKWPHWTPTANMMAAMPVYRDYASGLDGGIGNPLGARALYLYRNGRDTHFRLHGTNEPESIGHAVSSGCIRLFNQDIIDLYNRVPVGARVVVES
jgi:lipoprotein-anchoring transpeptidase ErfK/SrfK